MMEQPQEIRCKGLGVSEGIVIGQVLRMHDGTQHVYHWRIDDADVETERRRFRAAADRAIQQALTIKEQARSPLWQGSRLHF